MTKGNARSFLQLVGLRAPRLGDKLKLRAFSLRSGDQVATLPVVAEGRVLERQFFQAAVVEEVVGLAGPGTTQGVGALPPAVPLPEGFGKTAVSLQAERRVPADWLIQRIGENIPSLLERQGGHAVICEVCGIYGLVHRPFLAA